LSGNSAAPGVFPITVRVTDDTGFAVTQALTLTVSGTFVAPVLDPVNFPTITIGTDFVYAVTASNYPKSFIISGLPAGLKATSATGAITGYPTVSGVFNVKIRATNTGGSSPTMTARLTVKALDRAFVGTFGGLVARDAGVNANLGGSWSITSTSNGSFSLKVVSALAKSGASGGGASYAAKGRFAASAPQVNVEVGGQTLSLSINPSNGVVAGTLGTAAANGWKSTYNTLSNPADSLQGYYSFALDLANLLDRHNASIPQGIGFATFNVSSAGNVTIAGKTADGEAITSAMFAGPNGEVALYTPIYKKLGTIMGQLGLTEDAGGLFAGNRVSGPVTWFKPETKTKSYPDAFGPIDLNAEGAYLAPASKGNVVMGVPDPGAAGIFFADGGLDQSETDPNLTFTYTDDDKVVLPAAGANPAKVSLTINPATGAVSGKFSLVETSPSLKRSNIAFLGQVVRVPDGSVKAVGYFMLPQIPDPGKAASTAPSLSGGFTIEQSLP
jgi:hypothetical protein